MKFIYFSAPWCQPCKTLGPVMERVGQKHTVEKINIDVDFEKAKTFNIRSIPSVVLVDEDEQPITVLVGIKPESDYYEIIEEATKQ